MSKAGADATGLKELAANIDRFDKEVTARLRAVAFRKSREVKEIARRLAPRDDSPPRGTHTEGNPHLADSIVIVEHADKKEFQVFPETPWLPNLGLWIERGTVHESARPFMRPAGDQVDASYKAEMLAVADGTAKELLK